MVAVSGRIVLDRAIAGGGTSAEGVAVPQIGDQSHRAF